MRILIWSPNYAPELIGIPPLVTEAAEWLAQQGHDVDVVTALPNYPERRIFPGYTGRLWRSEVEEGVRVRRSWLRVRPGETFLDKGLYEASFAVLSAPRAVPLVRRADVVVCLVPTLFSAAIGALATRATRTRFVLWVQDLVLEAAESVEGVAAHQRSVLAAMRTVESLALRAADRVVACSPGFVPYLRAGGADPARLEVVPNWVDIDRFGLQDEPVVDGPVRFLYTGNVGYTQGFETLIAAARRLGETVTVEIVGGGNALARVRRMARSNVRVSSPVERAAYPGLLASAQALVILQRAVAANVNLPSKIAAYLASGRPIVASIGLDTPAAALLQESGAALVVAPESPVALAQAMRRLRDDVALRAELGAHGRAFARAHLAKERVLPALERALGGT